MKEWQQRKFGELYKVPSRNGVSKPSRVRGSGYKMINMGELFANDRIYDIDMELVPLTDNEKEKAKVESGDLLFARQSLVASGAGKCSIVMKTSELTVFESHLIRVRLDQEIADPMFYYYYFKSPRSPMRTIIEHCVQAGIKASDLEKLLVKVPPIEEQRKTARVLSRIDKKIEVNKEINENLEQQAKALFKSWFVDFEPFNGTMPSDWEIVSLEKIADFQNGYAFKSKELLNEPSPDCYQVFKQGHIARGGGFIPDGTKSWYPKSLASKLDKFVLKKGDILMAMTDMKDNVAILGNTAVMPLDNEYIVNQRVGHLRANGYKGVTYPFIYLLTNSTDFLVDLRSRANSGVQVNLSSSEIKASQTVLSSEEVNNAFSEITLPIFEIIISNQLENQRLAQLRDTLLPKLMSGELDVSDIEI